VFDVVNAVGEGQGYSLNHELCTLPSLRGGRNIDPWSTGDRRHQILVTRCSHITGEIRLYRIEPDFILKTPVVDVLDVIVLDVIVGKVKLGYRLIGGDRASHICHCYGK